MAPADKNKSQRFNRDQDSLAQALPQVNINIRDGNYDVTRHRKRIGFGEAFLFNQLKLLLSIIAFLATSVASSAQSAHTSSWQPAERPQNRQLSSEETRYPSSDPRRNLMDLGANSDNADSLVEPINDSLRYAIFQLQTETDPVALKASIATLAQFGAPALSALIEQNRQVYSRMTRASGRLLGLESALNRINVLGQPTPDELMSVYLFKQLPVEISRASLPWREAATDKDFFQVPDELGIQAAFRKEFEQSSKSSTVTLEDEVNARKEFDSSISDLWVNTQAIVSLLKSRSGKLGGVDLRATILLHPDLAGLDLQGIDAHSAVWMAPVLTRANLSFANLSKTEMRYADLRNANLTGTDVGRANFGKPNRSFENRTAIHLGSMQTDVTLDGANVWEMTNSFLKDKNFDPSNLQKLINQRREILARSGVDAFSK